MTRRIDGKMGMNTQLAHLGNDPRDFHGFVNPPVVHASTVLFPDAATMAARNQKYTYGTRGTPTSEALCKAIDHLEGSAGTVAVPSGLVAVTLPLLAFLAAGDHVLITDSVYHPTRNFADTVLKRFGVEVGYYDPEAGTEVASLLKPNTKVVFTESPASNTFEMQDIPAISEAAHAAGAIVMMDNTWATPLHFRPLDHGVDISIHAATKYPAGHSDVLIGSVSAQYAPFGLAFGIGAAMASLTFFTALGFGARALAPVFARPSSWVVLEVAVGCVMWAIAAGLAFGMQT